MADDKEIKETKSKIKLVNADIVRAISNNLKSYDHSLSENDRHFLSAPKELKDKISANPIIQIYKNYTSIYFYSDTKVYHLVIRCHKDKSIKAMEEAFRGL